MKYWSESNKLPFDQFLNNRLGRVWEFLDHFLQDLRANVPTLLQNASLTYHHQHKGYICKQKLDLTKQHTRLGGICYHYVGSGCATWKSWRTHFK